jgi:hypothetical protein
MKTVGKCLSGAAGHRGFPQDEGCEAPSPEAKEARAGSFEGSRCRRNSVHVTRPGGASQQDPRYCGHSATADGSGDLCASFMNTATDRSLRPGTFVGSPHRAAEADLSDAANRVTDWLANLRHSEDESSAAGTKGRADSGLPHEVNSTIGHARNYWPRSEDIDPDAASLRCRWPRRRRSCSVRKAATCCACEAPKAGELPISARSP